MQAINRRQFLIGRGVSLAHLLLPRWGFYGNALHIEAPPAPLGRIATWWRQAVRTEPSERAEWVTSKGRDEVIPLHASIVGEAPWPTNTIWYATDEGYIHGGYVQPVEDAPESEVVEPVDEPGFWAEVCIPFAEAHWRPLDPFISYKLYYGTVYRVVKAVMDDEGGW